MTKFIKQLGIIIWCLNALASISFAEPLLPDTDPRGKSDLTVCSQNLENFGRFNELPSSIEEIKDSDLLDKINALLDRIEKVQCDVVAVQEVFGSKEEKGKASLERLSGYLRARQGRIFDYVIGTGTDPTRVGFLVAKDKAEIVNSISYSQVELPKLSEKERPRFFARGPLEIQLKTKREGGKFLTLINIHFKSKRGAQEDPALLEWETYRMCMAEAIRRIVGNRHKGDLVSGKEILMILGDRNSNYDVASAKILEGTLTLQNFQQEGGCRLSKRGVPLCGAGTRREAMLFSVLTSDPQTKLLPGTFEFQHQFSWLDEILMPSPSLRYALTRFDRPGDYDSGVVGIPPEASDHSMVYVRLNW